MDHNNYERELKYIVTDNQQISPEDITSLFISNGYFLIERKTKYKQEVYYDDSNLTFIKRGDVIRCSSYINDDSVYTHFMYKKNVSVPNLPYVSKYEYGSGRYTTVNSFLAYLGIQANSKIYPVLYANMSRRVSIIEKDAHRLYVTYDKVDYFKDPSSEKVSEDMLEIEDWTTPNTIANSENRYDSHLVEASYLLQASGFPTILTKESKAFRGFTLLRMHNMW